MAIQIEKPEIKHKYISLFDTEAEFNAAYPNFEEVNWSDVAYPQERPDSYRVSRRLSNMYHKNTSPDYKFDDINDFVVEGDVTYYADGAYIGTFNEDDYTNGNIRKTFFLEIVWGYSGWEWHDYERVIGTDPETEESITETLKGGNLYKVRKIETVPSIIDGHRLQHINDFLNTQNKVTLVDSFDTHTIIAANRAFKRVGNDEDSSYPKISWNNILGCTLNVYEFINLEEADDLFYNNKIYIVNGRPFELPKIEKINGLYALGAYTPGLQFKFNSVKELTNAFVGAFFASDSFAQDAQGVINLNNIFIGDTLKNLTSFRAAMRNILFSSYYTEDNENISKIVLDLTGSNVSQDTVIDLGYFAYLAGPSAALNDRGTTPQNRTLSLDLNFNNDVNLEYFAANKKDKQKESYSSIYWRNGNFNNIKVNFNSKSSKIRNINHGFEGNYLPATVLQESLNNDCNEDFLYNSCNFRGDVEYDFSPYNSLNNSRCQFDNCNITGVFDLSNIKYLKDVYFRNIKKSGGINFPYVLNDANIIYFDDDYPQYRYISFYNSNIQNIPAQNIYVRVWEGNYDTSRNWFENNTSNNSINGHLSIFQNCRNIDFPDNFNMYVQDCYFNKDAACIINFKGCNSMTQTPIIHWKGATNSRFARLGFNFEGCINLKRIRISDIDLNAGKIDSPSDNNLSLTYLTTPNLVYADFGKIKVPMNFTGLRPESTPGAEDGLNVATLETSLMRQTEGFTLKLQDDVWTQLSANCRNHCLSIFSYVDHPINYPDGV